jgi:hypothetical protein
MFLNSPFYANKNPGRSSRAGPVELRIATNCYLNSATISTD